MRFKKFTLSAILLAGIGFAGLQAQETTAATGGNASGSGGSGSYSVGQVVYSTYTVTTGSVAQGVQQPFELSVVTGIEEAEGITLLVSAYPNPTADYLVLKVDDATRPSFKSIRYQLVDIYGKLLQSDNMAGNETVISMSKLVPAIYFVKVTEDNRLVKTFKITKN
jgi:hypothetical protein